MVFHGKVCIIGVYFGELPNTFSIWLQSCRYNPSIDFLIVTDQIIEAKADNIIIIQSDLEKIKRKIETLVGFPISLERPYKLCDYKPVYGKIFKDKLKGYDYWGHCDFDLIWGDIRYYIEKYHYWEYEKFLPFGHLTLYRNVCEVNDRYKMEGSITGNYKSVFTSSKSMLFDEYGMNSLYVKNGFPFFDENIFSDIDFNRYRMTVCEKQNNPKKKMLLYNQYLREIGYNKQHQLFTWEEGHVFRYYLENGKINKDEYIYIHLPKRAMNQLTSLENNRYYILSDGFKPIDKEITEVDIIQFNPYRGNFYEHFELFFSNWKGLLKKIKNLLKKNGTNHF